MVISQHKHSEFTLTPQEVARIYNSPTNYRDRVLIKTLYFAGLRRMEASKLRVPDVDFERGRIIVTAGKGGKQRILPFIDNDFRSDLQHLIGKRKEGAVFETSQGKPISNRMINWIVQKAGQTAGIKHPNPNELHINPHLFRHSIARHLKSLGFQAEWIQKFLGHSLMQTTTDTYGTIGIEEMQSIANKKLGLNLPQNEEVRRLQ